MIPVTRWRLATYLWSQVWTVVLVMNLHIGAAILTKIHESRLFERTLCMLYRFSLRDFSNLGFNWSPKTSIPCIRNILIHLAYFRTNLAPPRVTPCYLLPPVAIVYSLSSILSHSLMWVLLLKITTICTPCSFRNKDILPSSIFYTKLEVQASSRWFIKTLCYESTLSEVKLFCRSSFLMQTWWELEDGIEMHFSHFWS